MRKALLATAGLLTLSLGCARGQATLSFSGGNGSPFMLTLAEPLVFTVTREMPPEPSGPDQGPYFVFENVGNVLGSDPAMTWLPTVLLGSSNITFTVNGIPVPGKMNHIASGFEGASMGPNDLYFFGLVPGVAVGDVVCLSAGSFITSGSVAAPPAAAGLYTAFLMDGSGNLGSTLGAPIPEPQPAMLLATICVTLCVFMRKARKLQTQTSGSQRRPRLSQELRRAF